MLVRRSQAVAHARENRHDTAKAVHEGDEVCQVIGADEREVAGVSSVKQASLLVLGWISYQRRIWKRCIVATDTDSARRLPP